MVPVLVIDREGEVSIFASASHAADWMEAQDVIDGEYQVFDCAGRIYRPTATHDDDIVRVDPTDDLVHISAVREAVEHAIVSSAPNHLPPVLGSEDDLCAAVASLL